MTLRSSSSLSLTLRSSSSSATDLYSSIGVHHSLVKDGGIGVRDLRLNTGIDPTSHWTSEQWTLQINLLSKGLKFIPTLTVKENTVRQQLLLNLKQFARPMRLRYLLFTIKTKNNTPFPSHQTENPQFSHQLH